MESIRLLYCNDLNELAPVLVRAVLEYRINFDLFLQRFLRDPGGTMVRVRDAMMLEKLKQMEQTDYRGLDLVSGAPSKEQLRQQEAEIARRYEPKEVKAMRKYGFSGMSIEQRARQMGHLDRYNVVYRNFSRNVHGSDYAEHLMRDLSLRVVPYGTFTRARDETALSTCAWSAVGILEPTVKLFGIPVKRKLGSVNKMMKRLSDERFTPL